MPRYYFDVCDCDGLHRDDIGEDLSGFEEARQQCQSLLPDIAREELPNDDLHTVSCDVRDEAGHVVYRGELTFRGTRYPPPGRAAGPETEDLRPGTTPRQTAEGLDG